jgi:chromate reductase
MNVLVLAASPRKDSLTLRFCLRLEQMLLESPDPVHVRVLDFNDFDIPPVGKGTFSASSLTPFQSNLVSSWENADLVIICSPEYNWTANAELFIMLDRLGSKAFQHLFHERTFAFAGVSSGRGGRQPALDLQRVMGKVVSFMGGESIISPKIFEAQEVELNIGPGGSAIGESRFHIFLNDFLAYNLRLAKRWKLSSPRNEP